MSSKGKLIAAAVAAAVLVGGGVAAFLVLGDKGDLPLIGGLIEPETCPLDGSEPDAESMLDRPAVAVKIENSPDAYPLSGLGDAEVVYEELVEGGITRFMAIYHCNDSKKVGPVRSARVVDPAIMRPITRILVAAGANDIVKNVLNKADIITIGEDNAGKGLRRLEREGITSEHTLYGDTVALRKVGQKKFDDPPAEDIFRFGDIEGRSKEAKEVTIVFSGASRIVYRFSGKGYERFQPEDQAFSDETDEQVVVDNVLIEEHEVNNSDTIVDVEGNPSTEIADETGTGRAVLFRDGKAIEGSWSRESIEEPVQFETDSGEEMTFAQGSIWIHLVPSKKGELKGSFSYKKEVSFAQTP